MYYKCATMWMCSILMGVLWRGQVYVNIPEAYNLFVPAVQKHFNTLSYVKKESLYNKSIAIFSLRWMQTIIGSALLIQNAYGNISWRVDNGFTTISQLLTKKPYQHFSTLNQQNIFGENKKLLWKWYTWKAGIFNQIILPRIHISYCYMILCIKIRQNSSIAVKSNTV